MGGRARRTGFLALAAAFGLAALAGLAAFTFGALALAGVFFSLAGAFSFLAAAFFSPLPLLKSKSLRLSFGEGFSEGKIKMGRGNEGCQRLRNGAGGVRRAKRSPEA